MTKKKKPHFLSLSLPLLFFLSLFFQSVALQSSISDIFCAVARSYRLYTCVHILYVQYRRHVYTCVRIRNHTVPVIDYCCCGCCGIYTNVQNVVYYFVASLSPFRSASSARSASVESTNELSCVRYVIKVVGLRLVSRLSSLVSRLSPRLPLID